MNHPQVWIWVLSTDNRGSKEALSTQRELGKIHWEFKLVIMKQKSLQSHSFSIWRIYKRQKNREKSNLIIANIYFIVSKRGHFDNNFGIARNKTAFSYSFCNKSKQQALYTSRNRFSYLSHFIPLTATDHALYLMLFCF